MQPTETIWTTLVVDRPGILPVKFDGRYTTTDDGQMPVTLAYPEHFLIAKNKKPTNKVPVRSNIHGVPWEGILGWPVGEAFMVLTGQNHVPAVTQADTGGLYL